MSSEYRCAPISRKECIELLGSRRRRLGRVLLVQLAGLDRIGDDFVDLRRHPWLGARAGMDLVGEDLERAIFEGRLSVLEGRATRWHVTLGLGAPVDYAPNRLAIHRANCPCA